MGSWWFHVSWNGHLFTLNKKDEKLLFALRSSRLKRISRFFFSGFSFSLYLNSSWMAESSERYLFVHWNSKKLGTKFSLGNWKISLKLTVWEHQNEGGRWFRWFSFSRQFSASRAFHVQGMYPFHRHRLFAFHSIPTYLSLSTNDQLLVWVPVVWDSMGYTQITIPVIRGFQESTPPGPKPTINQ